MKQKTIQEKYNLLTEGKLASVDFLKTVKKDYPHLISNVTSLDDAKSILKQKRIINENYIDLKPINSYEPRKEESYESAFKQFLKEEQEEKAEAKKVSKNVEDLQDKTYDFKDEKNINNISSQQFYLGVYAECKDPKNTEKTLEEVKDIVAKKLGKDPLHYVKNNLHGVEGIGLEEMNAVIEAKGKFKSSGYGDLDKDSKSLIKEGLFSKKTEPKDGEVQKMKTQGFLSKIMMGSKGHLSNKIVNPPTQFIEDLVEYSKECGYTFWTGDSEKKDDPYAGHFWTKYRSIYCCTEQSKQDDFAVWVYENNDLFFNRKGYDAKTNQWILDNSPKNLQEGKKFDIDLISSFNNGLMQQIAESVEDMSIDEANEALTGLIVRVGRDDIKSFENWLDQSQFFAEDEGGGEYFFPEEEANYDNLERFLAIDMAAEDIEVEFEGVFPKSVVHESKQNLLENKNMNLQKRLKEIERSGANAAVEAKITALQEEIDSRQSKIATVSENEALSDFINKDQIKVIEKEIKELEKHKSKLEKVAQKNNKGGATTAAKVIDEDPEEGGDNVEESFDEFEEHDNEPSGDAGDLDYSWMDDDDDINFGEESTEDFSSNEENNNDFQMGRINEGYTNGDRIDFLSQINHPNPQHKTEFQHLDKLSGRTVKMLFESYFPEKVKK